jgi:peptide/nickel transport system substrate-binding protein
MRKGLCLFITLAMALVMVMTGCGGGGGTASEKTSANVSSSTNENTVNTSEASSEPVMSDLCTVAITATPPTLDLVTTSAASTMTMGFHIFEMLVAYNAESVVTPMLATSWEANADNTVFTFKMKEGVTFHNGSDFTSEDAKASIERYARVGYRKQALFSNMKSAEAPDPKTLVITLTKPTPLFINDLALTGMGPVVILPSEVCGKEHDYPNLTNDLLIGTGPYILEEFVPDDHITLKRFEKYVPDTGIKASGFVGERNAWFKEVKFVIAPEKASRLNGLISGEYQYAEELDVSTYDKLKGTEGIRPDIISPAWIPNTIINTMSGPMKDKKVRQAMVMALDDESCLIAATGNNKEFYEVNPSLFYSNQIWYSDIGKDKYNQKNIEGAKALLAESSYKGETIKWATTKDYEWMYQISVVAQQQLKEIGLNIELEVNDWPTMIGLLINGSRDKKWDLFSTGMSLYDVIDPTGMNGLLMKDAVVLPYVSDEMDQIMKNGMSSSDQKVRKAEYDKMMTLFYEDVPFLVYGKTNTLNGASDKLMGEKSWFVTRMWNVWLKK